MTNRLGPAVPLSEKDRAAMRVIVKDSPRNHALFVMGMNTAFRASDLLSLNVGDVAGKNEVRVKEKKTGKWRQVPLNAAVVDALKPLTVNRKADEPLFVGEKRGTRLTVCTLSRLWRSWAEEAGVGGKVASHSGRKTFARTNFERGVRIETLMVSLNHSSPAQTLAYIHVLPSEVEALYAEPI